MNERRGVIQANPWRCSCVGVDNDGSFCTECGRPKRLAPEEWTCVCCGREHNEGKFCTECGKPRPTEPTEPAEWTCISCGSEHNQGRFCRECGAPAPEAKSPVATPTIQGAWLKLRITQMHIDENGFRTEVAIRSEDLYPVKPGDSFYEDGFRGIVLGARRGMSFGVQNTPFFRIESMEAERLLWRDALEQWHIAHWGEDIQQDGLREILDGPTRKPIEASRYHFSFYQSWEEAGGEGTPFEAVDECLCLMGKRLGDEAIPEDRIVVDEQFHRTYLKIPSKLLNYEVNCETFSLEQDRDIDRFGIYSTELRYEHLCAAFHNRYRFLQNGSTPYIPSNGGATYYAVFEDPETHIHITVAACRSVRVVVGQFFI